jgi:tRNA(fMet)-specific endonuclease VapC
VTGNLVLDTSAEIAFLRGVPGISSRMGAAQRLWLPLIALGELEFGVENSFRSNELRKTLNSCLKNVALLHLTKETASVYAKVRRSLSEAGSPIPENDVWIAAQATEHTWHLAALDSHFTRVEGLQLEDWRGFA